MSQWKQIGRMFQIVVEAWGIVLRDQWLYIWLLYYDRTGNDEKYFDLVLEFSRIHDRFELLDQEMRELINHAEQKG